MISSAVRVFIVLIVELHCANKLWTKNENYCIPKKCYTFDTNLGQCKKSGTDHVVPLVLQAIPFTAVFGSGFGNIGRWDLFGMYMGILFGGCAGKKYDCFNSS